MGSVPAARTRRRRTPRAGCRARPARRRARRRRPGARGSRNCPNAIASPVDGRLDQVHRRRADERRDEEIVRRLVEPLRHVDLDDPPVAHHRDSLAERHRLGLIVRHVDARDREPRMELRERRAHPDAELRVEVRERLVHQERLRLADDRPAHRDALPLPAGEVRGLAVEQVLEPEQRRDLLHPAPISRFGVWRTLSPKPRFCAHVHVRDRARSSGRPSRCRARAARGRSRPRSPIEIVPSVISSRPAIIRSSVDFPQPDGPTSTMNSPSCDRQVDVVDGDDAAGERPS